ncbi:putative integrase core domain protein [Rhizophagus clarus]|uniref:Putative integrase core domain protein n=1 Tax=Rhizophagus clarus TaxID=94130 RepID=A0A8H3KZG7_9GLOM|nr:putative integrase core domain protein [Rhizophagus clarus]
MDPNQYHQIYQYLHQQILPTFNTSREKQKFINLCNNFELKLNYLYKKNKRKNGQLLKVIRNFELEPLLYMMHNDPTAAHFAVDTMFNKIKDRYYWPQMYENIREYVRSCDSCQRRGKSKANQLLHPIAVHGPFYQVGIDFVGPLPITPNGNRYIIVAMDYMTKWPEARPVSRATAEETSQFIYENIICRHGCPAKLLSDRGTHFNNQMVEKLLEKFGIKHVFSTSYHPQTNGLVERFNRTLCESLSKLVIQTNEWDRYIAPVLFAYRTSKHSTTKISPFYLVNGREAKLPVDNLSDNLEHINQRLLSLIDDLPHVREEAKIKVRESQVKQKDYHDQKIKKELNFEIGDKVLYYDAAKEKQWTGKLDPKWKGPFYIHEIRQNGAYKLRSMEGKVLRTPVNGSLLKLYNDRQNWAPIIAV